ncbi:hypothetical protein A3759_17195 [Thalassolituus sp. HI0120]|nr:hypothetical protein A3759_17195 [Thalassolituus sp. HI0120]
MVSLFPLIKPCNWQGFQKTEQQFLQDSVLDDKSITEPLPKIVYAIDHNDQLAFLSENFFEGKSDEEVKNKAYADLRQVLAEEDWKKLDLNHQCEDLEVFNFSNEFSWF